MKPFILLLFICLTTTLYAQPGRYIPAKHTACQVWDEPYNPTDSATWSGPCKGGYAAGQGTLVWFTDGKPVGTYTGTMQQGKITGRGRYVIPGYGTLEGAFVNSQMEGQGKITLESGGILKGNFLHNTLLDLDATYLKRLHKIMLPIRDTTHFYTEETDSLFYYALPPAAKPKAALILLASSGESVENVISSNKKLMQLAADSGFLCMVPAMNQNKELNADPAAFSFLNYICSQVEQQYNLAPDKFIFYGLSLGGCNALLYTELSRNPAYHTTAHPSAVIGIDPPVDNIDLYNGAADEIKRYAGVTHLTPAQQAALTEDRFLVSYYTGLYGGTPAQVPATYNSGSQFSRREADGGNARYLIDVPVRLYNDPDILWNMTVKGRDYYHMNAANHSAMILFLMQHGNKNAQLIPALGKGYRIDGTRHPHSWSIVEPVDCIKWMLRFIK